MRRHWLGLLCLLTLLPTALRAQDKWCVVDMADPAKPLTTVENVCFLLAADGAPTLTVVCRDGRLMGGVASVGFRQLDPTPVSAPKADGGVQIVGTPVGQSISIMGCDEGTEVKVCDLGGHVLKAATATDGQLTIGVADLKSGIYLLKAGTVTIKFTRK